MIQGAEGAAALNVPAPGRSVAARVARGGVIAFGVYVSGAGLTYCSQLMTVRSIGAEGFGIYAYVFACMTVLGYCAALGFDVSILRFVPAYRAMGEWGRLRGVVQCAERCAAALGCAVAAVGASLVWAFAGEMPRDLAATFCLGFLLVPLWALLWIRCSVVRAFGGVVTAVAPDRIVRDGVLIALMGGALLAPGPVMTAPLTMAATVMASAAALAAVSLAKRRGMPRALIAVRPVYAGRVWARAGLPLVTISVADVAMNRTGVVLLGWVGSTTDAGIYALAFSIAFLAALPRTAINALLAPAISDLFVRDDRAALQVLAARSALWTLLGGAAIALPIGAVAEPLLGWFGPDFVAGASALRILLLGQVVVAATGSQLYLLTMTGRERSAAVLMLASAAGNLLGGAGLVMAFGLNGAAVACTLTLLGGNAAMALLVWRHLGLTPGPLAALRRHPDSPARSPVREAGH